MTNSIAVAPAHAISAYIRQKGMPWESTPKHLNIVYIEGVNPDFSSNNDALDGWNDLRIVIDHDADGHPYIAHLAVATTEPGRASIFSAEARAKGGVARLAFRHYSEKWVMGYHNYSRSKTAHPALVQKRGAVIMVHRDLNRDGKRIGDKMGPATGINHHSTSPTAKPATVGRWSAGSLVGLEWAKHLEFLELLKTDARFVESPSFAFSATIIAGDDLLRFRTSVA